MEDSEEDKLLMKRRNSVAESQVAPRQTNNNGNPIAGTSNATSLRGQRSMMFSQEREKENKKKKKKK